MGKYMESAAEVKVMESPSRDTSARFALDALLREYGFVIHSRRVGKEPVWKCSGELFSQQEALMHLDPDDVWYAEFAENAEAELGNEDY